MRRPALAAIALVGLILCLAAFWAWTGLVYHIGFFAAINPLAFAFGAAFVLESALLPEGLESTTGNSWSARWCCAARRWQHRKGMNA